VIERAFRWQQFEDPNIIKFLFGNRIMAPIFLLARLYVGWQFIQAGYDKVSGDGWLNQDGSSLKAFWTRIVAIPQTGSPPIKYGWYRDFIQFMLDHHWYSWFAYIIAFGELCVGIAMIVGIFTGLAAIFGATLNFNFLLAGSASTNPVLFLLAILILLGWKVSGYIGVDRWLLPALGTPWHRGAVFTKEESAEAQGRAGPAAYHGA
jgi:thiosulfate dehydrogenase [quinone] large subunit